MSPGRQQKTTKKRAREPLRRSITSDTSSSDAPPTHTGAASHTGDNRGAGKRAKRDEVSFVFVELVRRDRADMLLTLSKDKFKD